MKVNELMIGDWVYRMDFNTPVLTKIIGMEVVNYDKMEYVVDVLNKNGYNVQLYLNEIEPILLTSEILEKNEFLAVNGVLVLIDEYTNDEIIILRKIANGFIILTERMTIGLQNVHELQHVLRLCGIDKTIKL